MSTMQFKTGDWVLVETSSTEREYTHGTVTGFGQDSETGEPELYYRTDDGETGYTRLDYVTIHVSHGE
jgi:hypothetical protein